MNRAATLILFVVTSIHVTFGQERQITLEECYAEAEQNYPLFRQLELIEKAAEYNINNATRRGLPSFVINGQETYQSDITQVPIQMPELQIEPPSKHQYKVYGEVSMKIYDGGTVRNERQLAKDHASVSEHQVKVDLYKLKERVNEIYFGILFLDARLRQNQLLQDEIQRGIKQVRASIDQGTALKSSVDALHAELLKAKQQQIEFKTTRSAYVDMLAQMTGKALNDKTVFETPQTTPTSFEINRPELSLFAKEKTSVDVHEKIISARLLPKLSLFFQGGYGRPALNMLDNSAEAYYVTGVRLTWTISNFYTAKNDRALLDIRRRTINVQEETFRFNTLLALKQLVSEIEKLEQALRTDDQIIEIREKIRNTAASQLANGVIHVNDYVQEVTEEDEARQNKALHEVMLLFAQYRMKTTSGI